MKMRMTCIVLATLSLISCTVGPDYRAPQPNFSNKWSTAGSAQKVTSCDPIDVTWWEQFNDPLLNHFIQEAVLNNLDIKKAEANILSARALRQVAAADFYPKIDAIASDQSKRISIRGSQLAFFKGIQPRLVDFQRRLYNLGFDASWEIDLFGHTRRQVEAQNAYIWQQVADRRKILLTTIAEVARNYLEYRGTQQLIRYTKKTIYLQKKNYNLIHERYDAGEDNELNVSLAKSEWTNVEAQLPNLTAQLRSHAYQLAVLIGRDPQDILCDLNKPSKIHIKIKRVPIGLRLEVLRRRPDVFVAERELAQSVAEIGVAVAELYPKITLIGDYVYDSDKLSKLFFSDSRTWVFGPALSLPIFRGGALRANVCSKKALANAALHEFQSTVLHALQDVDTALVRYGQEIKTMARLRSSVASQTRTVRLAHERYQGGEDDVLALITAEQNLYSAQINLIQSRIQVQTNLVSLYKSLGGGWEVFEAPC